MATKNNGSNTSSQGSYIVNGRITDRQGEPLVGLTVRAFDKDLRREQLLGEDTPGNDGKYRITYKREQFRRAEKRNADLLVRVYGPEGNTLGSSDIIFNAEPVQKIDLTISVPVTGLSELEKLLEDLEPVLEDVQPADITTDDIAFLAPESGQDQTHISYLAIAHRLANQTDLDPAVFYGTFRQGLATELLIWLTNSLYTIRDTLEKSIRENIIPADLATELDNIMAAIGALGIEQPTFLAKPDVLFTRPSELTGLTESQKAFIAEKLNSKFRAEAVSIMGEVSRNLRTKAVAIAADLDYQEYAEVNLAAVVTDTILAALKQDGELAEEVKAIASRLSLSTSPSVAAVLRLDQPLANNPLFETETRFAKTHEYARMAQLNEETAKQLFERDVLLDDVDHAKLFELVKENVLSEQQRLELLAINDFGKLTGENITLIEALRDGEAMSVSDYVAWQLADWQQLINRETIPLPFGETAESYTLNIQANIEKAYPSQTLLSRLTHSRQISQLSNLDVVNDLFRNNERLLSSNGAIELDWRGISVQRRAKMETALKKLSDFANTYRYLGAMELVNDKQLDIQQKKNSLDTRVKWLQSFYDNNKKLDLRFVNLIDKQDSTLDWRDIPVAGQTMVRNQLKAYQRLLSLGVDTADRQLLLGKAYDSAMTIVGNTESDFLENSGLSLGTARMVYSEAQENALSVSHQLGSVRDLVYGNFKDIALANIDPKMINDLRDIDGFDDLFGPQDYCECKECSSILGPAAYFVDLMYFIEQNASKPVFIVTKKTNHPLYLKNRRQDLWRLVLSCENTHTLLPYLTIVNEVLETYLTTLVGSDIYNKISKKSEKVSFGLPVNVALEELRLYLGHFKITPFDIYRLRREPETKIWRARLDLSQDEYDVITTFDPTGVKQRLGNPTTLTDFPVQDFIRLAGITRQQLDELLALRYHADLQNLQVKKKTSPDELQNFPEILKNLTNKRLDFIHRLIRLWEKTSWTIPELDLVLTALNQGGLIGSDLKSKAVLHFAQSIDIQAKLNLSVEELCSFADQLPVSKDYPKPPAKQADRRLYERLFDLKQLFGESSSTNHELNQTTTFHYYGQNTVNSNDKKIDANTPLLLAGLGITETELFLLLDHLKNDLVFNANGDMTLDRKKVSLLFRHARLAKALLLSIADFVTASQLLFASGNTTVTTLKQIFALYEFVQSLKTSPFSVPELCFVLTGEEKGAIKYKTSLKAVGKIVQAVQKLKPSDDIAALKTELSKCFNLTAQTLGDLLKWTSTDINSNAVKDALKATFTKGVPDNPAKLKSLFGLIKQLERVVLLFSELKFKPKTIAYLSSKTSALGITNPKQLTYVNIKSLVFYKTQSALDTDAEPLVQAILDSYVSTQNLDNDRVRLAELWQQDNSLIESLVSLVSTPGVAIEVLKYLWDNLAVCRILGINAYSLDKLAKDTSYANLEAAKDVALGAFSSKYDDEKTRKNKLEPYRDQVNVIKRDALCDYIIARKKDLKFQDYRDIYAFFLLDVEMSGCFRTSRVQCAIASLQLYVHRCLINLEQSDSILNPSIPNISVAPSRIPAHEWAWRKNYRVWEANRKVFLYPESYIEPDLRDNKTPIFKELEDELLQEKITKESAQLAYKKYFSQYAEMARLRIAGSYYYKATSTYYFFGRNQQDPPQYYYRKWVDHNVWTPWEKIELTIASDHVSAIIHQGRLYLFWTDMKTKEETKIKGGDATIDKVHHKLSLNYSFMDEKEKWISPQNIHFFSRTFSKNYTFGDACFPAIYKNNLYLFYGDKALYQTYEFFPATDFNTGVLSAQLNLFQNRLTVPGFLPSYYYDKYDTWSDLDPPYALLIRSKSHLLKLYSQNYKKGKKNVNLYFASTSALIVYHNKSPFHEAELNDSLLTSGSSGSKVTSAFNTRNLDPAIQVVGNRPGGFIFKVGNQQYLIEGQLEINQGSDTSASKTPGLYIVSFLSNRFMYRLTTSVADELGEKLFSKGLEAFLAPKTQKKYKEHPVGIKFPKPSELMGPYDDPKHIDYTGAFGLYYKELYFHIPFLIANHLNANQKFKEAKWWYERIFNPMASDPESKTSKKDSKKDLNWRYLEFRDISIQKMKEILTDKATIAQYKKNPFNPHAIARLRLSAYQKAIVMKYIDNLLDWGDHLFAKDTRESINEATMLYVLAADILGRRPAKLGSCKTAKESDLTYSNIGPDIKDSEFLITLENWIVTAYVDSLGIKYNSALVAGGGQIASGAAITASGAMGSPSGGAVAGAGGTVTAGAVAAATDTAAYSGLDIADVSAKVSDKDLLPYKQLVEWQSKKADTVKMWEAYGPIQSYPGISIAKQSALAFCVPPNEELLKYWDRVEDRLYKIRYCMNISGVRRSLALFEPPLSPMALVRAKAAGLSLEDIVGKIAALPPYRFSYLIEKAKQLTQTVQSFGNALLNALEKKDVEELTLLRSVHERNILRMTKAVKKQQIKDAKYQYRAQLENKTNVQNRINYYQGLISEGLIEWETTQQITKHVGVGLQIAETVLRLTSGIAYLVPQVGSPFAMTYGGKETGDSTLAFSDLMASLARIFESISASAGLEATFQRREQEWQQQLLLAQRELKQIEQQCLAAEVRHNITEKELDIHNKNMTQTDELYKFYKNKFSNLGLYTYLSTNLNRLYREAYNVAYNMATQAQHAYQFERDDNTTYIAGDNWQYDRAGLLAGERLLLQLQQMENSYLKANTRSEEVTQSISLLMLEPKALLTLQQTGKCTFKIPEIVFDLAYPGQYKRLIKSVRLTIPSVVGPYSNISARLTLTKSEVRKTHKSTNLDVAPNPKLTSIATSHANNDSGLFELNFRDERYLPFEGAGVVSEWQLELPENIRLFDYDTISDVIMHISYTAKYDGTLKSSVESQIATTLTNLASSQGLYRLLSLRHEYPNAYHKLLNPAAGSSQVTTFDVTKKHFPFFLSNEALKLSQVTVYLQPKGSSAIDTANLTLKINDNAFTKWDLLVGKMKGEKVGMSGDITKKWTVDAGVNGLNKDKVDDILLLVKYKI